MPKPLHLDGRALEGGGQLIRIALALSALTNQPLTINHIRASRQGKKGLKGSHLAAVKFLAEMSNCAVEGAEIGSTSLSFHPPATTTTNSPPLVRQQYTIQLSTAGSVFLVFQALYPYLLHAGGLALTDPVPIRVDITGGTNVSFSPSFDYIVQVLGPNLGRLGLPRLSVRLYSRGWGTGPVELGSVRCLIHPLSDASRPGRVSNYGFPSINLDDHVRGKVAQIDVTVLAPDNPATEDKLTFREFIENETIQELCQRLPELPPSIFQTSASSSNPETVPIQIHTSERTYHRTHIYLLIVAHTSTGFRIGRDALYGETKEISTSRSKRPKRYEKNQHQSKDDTISPIQQLVKRCIDHFLNELYNRSFETEASHQGKHQPCVDEYMRDQLVIFEALGRLSAPMKKDKEKEDGVLSTTTTTEDERYWSLHTQTARWVCEQVLGVEW